MRSLARAGWDVGVGSQASPGHAQRSRYATRWHPVPLAEAGEDAFTCAVADAVRAGSYDVVFAVGDAEVLTLSKRRAQVPACVPWPEHDVVVRCFDKRIAAELAAFAGLATPATGTSGGFPVVVKARTHWLGGDVGSASRFPVRLAEDEAELTEHVEALREQGVPAIVQQYVSGELIAQVWLLDKTGAVLACQQQVAEKVWPKDAGVSVRARTVAVDADLAAAARRFLADLGWWGLCELQFLVGGDGVPRLIDVNGRFYGSLALATAAGLPVAPMWAALALGDEVAPAPPARTGVRYQWLEGDLRRARVEGGVGSALRYAFGAQHSLLSLRDPKPGLGEAIDVFRRSTGHGER